MCAMKDEILIDESYQEEVSETSVHDLLLYELTTMNETFVTERALSSKQLLETTKLVKQVNEQINQLKTLAPEVHQYLNRSINASASSVTAIISKQSAQAATKGAEDIVRKLEIATTNAQNALQQYRQGLVKSQWKVIGVAAATTITTSLLITWLLMPRATLPLTDLQIHYLNSGVALGKIWPQLSHKEKEHWNELSKHRNH